MLWEISLLIIAIAILFLVIIAIPTIYQFRRTAKNIELTAKTLNQNLPGILTNIDEITTSLFDTVHIVSEQTEGLKDGVNKIHDMIENIVDFERQIREEIESPLIETVSTISAIIKGSRAFIDVLRSKR